MAEGMDPIQVISKLGLQPQSVTSITLIHSKHAGRLYRVIYNGQSLVIKCFEDGETNELEAYRLLVEQDVPTLPVYGISQAAILIDDLDYSKNWRLAEASDVAKVEIGKAVAEWYKALHSAGAKIASSGLFPDFLSRESDLIDKAVILNLAQKLGLAKHPSLKLAVEHIDAINNALKSFPETLNYNDFHWTNLALSREAPSQAIVFDYHLIGIGPAYSDIRNVTGSLEEPAKTSFLEAYGPVDARAAVFDKPISILYSLHVDSQLPKMPVWAENLINHILDGGFEVDIRCAIEVSHKGGSSGLRL